MSFTRDLGLGLSGFMRAFGFALSNRMGWMFLVPVVLWVVLAFGLFTVLQGPVDALSSWIADRLGIPMDPTSTNWWSDVKAFLNGAREVIVMVVLKLAIAYLLFIANKYIVLVVLSPLLAYASERTEEVLTGRSFPFSWRQLLHDALRGALLALRNGVMELACTVGIWFLTLFVPPLAPISFILLFLVSSYFYGFSMFDYVFERRRLRIGERVRAVNDRIGAVMANGMLFGLLMKLPLLGVMFAPVMASIGAVLATVKKEQGSPSQQVYRNEERLEA
ncbi:MAG: EI24 domain-containing protein [Flavobacteriales bacterium]|nr:EI24 domain-containing protein [Flavobacteriales bacterium]